MLYFKLKLNYTYTCTMKPYDILKVKNALIKPACCVSECTVTCFLRVLSGNISLFLAPCLTGIAQ